MRGRRAIGAFHLQITNTSAAPTGRPGSVKILCVAPHADDEVLGCGGTLHRWGLEGHETRVLILTERKFPISGVLKTNRAKALGETRKVCKVLGIGSYEFGGFSIRDLPEYRSAIIDFLESERRHFNPDLVLIPDADDTHQDHRATNEAACIVWRPHLAHDVRLWAYQAPSGYGFVGNQYVRLTQENLDAKKAAMKLYECEVREWPSMRCDDFIQAQAVMMGGKVGCERAEAFRHILGVV